MADVADNGVPLGAVELVGEEAGTPVVRLSGEIDISNAESLGDSLDAMVGPDARGLIVELAPLDFMDSAGIAMLLRAAARVDTVEIRNPSDVMRRIIECTGLVGIFRITG